MKSFRNYYAPIGIEEEYEKNKFPQEKPQRPITKPTVALAPALAEPECQWGTVIPADQQEACMAFLTKLDATAPARFAAAAVAKTSEEGADKDTCPVCYETMGRTTWSVTLQPCTHKFCLSCVEEIFETWRSSYCITPLSCPYCRDVITQLGMPEIKADPITRRKRVTTTDEDGWSVQKTVDVEFVGTIAGELPDMLGVFNKLLNHRKYYSQIRDPTGVLENPQDPYAYFVTFDEVEALHLARNNMNSPMAAHIWAETQRGSFARRDFGHDEDV